MTIVFLSICLVIAITYIIYLKSPLNDSGHRFYGVKSKKAQSAFNSIFQIVAELKHNMTFKIGPSIHSSFNNGSVGTNFHSFSDKDKVLDISASGPSFVVRSPLKAVKEAKDILENYGFTADIITDLDPSVGKKLVIVKTDAADGWVLVFRKHILFMGKRPKNLGYNY